MSYPPRPQHDREIQQMLAVFSSVVDGREAVYVSSPLTTGRSHSEWQSRRDAPDEEDPGYFEELRRHVLTPNRTSARIFVSQLRERETRVVIDPLGLEDVEGWTQDDYRTFWGRVVEDYARSVIFREGWEYSSGCAFEFLAAVRSGAELLDENLRPLSAEQGRRLLRSAIMENESKGHPISFLASVLGALDESGGGHQEAESVRSAQSRER